jgi:hypothetical protein
MCQFKVRYCPHCCSVDSENGIWLECDDYWLEYVEAELSKVTWMERPRAEDCPKAHVSREETSLGACRNFYYGCRSEMLWKEKERQEIARRRAELDGDWAALRQEARHRYVFARDNFRKQPIEPEPKSLLCSSLTLKLAGERESEQARLQKRQVRFDTPTKPAFNPSCVKGAHCLGLRDTGIRSNRFFWASPLWNRVGLARTGRGATIDCCSDSTKKSARAEAQDKSGQQRDIEREIEDALERFEKDKTDDILVVGSEEDNHRDEEELAQSTATRKPSKILFVVATVQENVWAINKVMAKDDDENASNSAVVFEDDESESEQEVALDDSDPHGSDSTGREAQQIPEEQTSSELGKTPSDRSSSPDSQDQWDIFTGFPLETLRPIAQDEHLAQPVASRPRDMDNIVFSFEKFAEQHTLPSPLPDTSKDLTLPVLQPRPGFSAELRAVPIMPSPRVPAGYRLLNPPPGLGMAAKIVPARNREFSRRLPFASVNATAMSHVGVGYGSKAAQLPVQPPIARPVPGIGPDNARNRPGVDEVKRQAATVATRYSVSLFQTIGPDEAKDPCGLGAGGQQHKRSGITVSYVQVGVPEDVPTKDLIDVNRTNYRYNRGVSDKMPPLSPVIGPDMKKDPCAITAKS